MPLAPGTRLGPYEVLAPLGAGGMGEVWRARDTKLARDVALKVLPDHLADDPKALARFENEAKAVAALSHPHILAIHDFGRIDGVSFVVTELLEGETLRAALLRGPLPLRKALDVAAQLADALAAAHEKEIVHRDVKPENVILTKDGRAKLLDFGLAHHDTAFRSGDDTHSPTVSRNTDPGTILGTVAYMSPEQAQGHPAGYRSDQFSLGVVLYEMLSGKRPFHGAVLRRDPRGHHPHRARAARNARARPRPRPSAGSSTASSPRTPPTATTRPATSRATSRRAGTHVSETSHGPDTTASACASLPPHSRRHRRKSRRARLPRWRRPARSAPPPRRPSDLSQAHVREGKRRRGAGSLRMDSASSITAWLGGPERRRRCSRLVSTRPPRRGRWSTARGQAVGPQGEVRLALLLRRNLLQRRLRRAFRGTANPFSRLFPSAAGRRGRSSTVSSPRTGAPDGKTFAVVRKVGGRRSPRVPSRKGPLRDGGLDPEPQHFAARRPRGLHPLAIAHGYPSGDLLVAGDEPESHGAIGRVGARAQECRWSPDGSEIWFTAGRPWGSQDLHAMSTRRKDPEPSATTPRTASPSGRLPWTAGSSSRAGSGRSRPGDADRRTTTRTALFVARWLGRHRGLR